MAITLADACDDFANAQKLHVIMPIDYANGEQRHGQGEGQGQARARTLAADAA